VLFILAETRSRKERKKKKYTDSPRHGGETESPRQRKDVHYAGSRGGEKKER